MASSSILSLLAVASFLQLAGVVMHTTSMATPFWITYSNNDQSPNTFTSEGIFIYCLREGCKASDNFTWSNYLAIGGAVFGCLATLVGVIFLSLFKRNQNVPNMKLARSSGIIGVFSGVLIAAACIYYRFVVYDNSVIILDIFSKYIMALGYSFYLSVGGAGAIIVGSIVLFCGIKQLQNHLRGQASPAPYNNRVNMAYVG